MAEKGQRQKARYGHEKSVVRWGHRLLQLDNIIEVIGRVGLIGITSLIALLSRAFGGKRLNHGKNKDA